MVSARFQAVELPVECVGKPGHRMPISGVKASESPMNVGPVKTVLDVAILNDVADVVEIYELVMCHWPEYDEDRGHQSERNQEFAPPGTEPVHRVHRRPKISRNRAESSTLMCVRSLSTAPVIALTALCRCAEALPLRQRAPLRLCRPMPS